MSTKSPHLRWSLSNRVPSADLTCSMLFGEIEKTFTKARVDSARWLLPKVSTQTLPL